MLLGDDVPARLHWPRHAELRVNNMQYRPYGRSGAMRLGANARDEPASIGTLCFHGRNALSLSAADNRPFCLVVQVRHAACRQGFGRIFIAGRDALSLSAVDSGPSCLVLQVQRAGVEGLVGLPRGL